MNPPVRCSAASDGLHVHHRVATARDLPPVPRADELVVVGSGRVHAAARLCPEEDHVDVAPRSDAVALPRDFHVGEAMKAADVIRMHAGHVVRDRVDPFLVGMRQR